MADLKLTGFDKIIRLKMGLRANLLSLATKGLALQGEPFYTADTKHLFIADESFVPQPVQTLDMALTFDGNIIVHNGDIVYRF